MITIDKEKIKIKKAEALKIELDKSINDCVMALAKAKIFQSDKEESAVQLARQELTKIRTKYLAEREEIMKNG